jgi:hypothetical protein
MGYEKTQRGGVHYILVVAAIAVLAGAGLSGEEFCAVLPFCLPCAAAADAQPVKKYFAHPAVEDRDGVIAPWYRGQNGQCDFRVRIAAETLKRYPWTDKSVAVMAAPYFVFSGSWGIKPDGTILVSPKLDDWMNADVGQRSVSTLSAEVAYYHYTGDPAAIGLIALTADYLLDYVDSTGHPWRPATEFIMRRGTLVDLVPTSFWTEPQLTAVTGASDPELYRYGVYGRDFTAYFTVAPGQIYHVRLKFCQARNPARPGGYATTIRIDDKPLAVDMDIAATAGGLGKAFDLVVNDVRPQHGVIAIHFLGAASGVAMIQAVEAGPGNNAAGP